MGDTAEMILEGVLCEACGEFIGKPVGHPRDCRSCREEMGDIAEDGEFEFDDMKNKDTE